MARRPCGHLFYLFSQQYIFAPARRSPQAIVCAMGKGFNNASAKIDAALRVWQKRPIMASQGLPVVPATRGALLLILRRFCNKRKGVK